MGSIKSTVDFFLFSIQLIMTLLCSEPTNGFPCHSEQIPKSLPLSVRPYMLWSLLPIQYYFLPLFPLISCSLATVIFLLFPENVKYLPKYFSSEPPPSIPMLLSDICISQLVTFFRYLLKCHFIREVFLITLKKIVYHPPISPLPYFIFL